MPLGFERLNERKQRPNALINFIRPLPGPTSSTAEAILSRVAAVCYPFMKSHMVLVQALEEFPYNTEFVGRNFNAGEVIQLVLRNRQGQWLPERMVMMVMVHELAHCKQMNHSKAFWKVRDQYAVDLRGLWAKGYTGEGLWGRGRNLDTGEVHAESVEVGDVPEHLCGGTYGRRQKRRKGGKEKQALSYAEKKQRRILKKFGAGGLSLGADDYTKVKLEGGVAKKGKPRVAGSARGRELRAAAALARFDNDKKEYVEVKKEEVETESETDEEYEVVGDDCAVDIDGKKMVDDKGRALVKICEDEDDNDGNAQREMDEIQGVKSHNPASRKPNSSNSTTQSRFAKASHSGGTSHQLKEISATRNFSMPATNPTSPPGAHVLRLDEIYKRRPDHITRQPPAPKSQSMPNPRDVCAICSLVNEPGSLSCAACSNVLKPHLMPNHWKCRSDICKTSEYINPADAGICGVCGASKPVSR